MPRLTLDVMGGDNPPLAMLQVGAHAVPFLQGELVLIGDKPVMTREVARMHTLRVLRSCPTTERGAAPLHGVRGQALIAQELVTSGSYAKMIAGLRQLASKSHRDFRDTGQQQQHLEQPYLGKEAT